MSGNGKVTVDREKVWRALEADPTFQQSTPLGKPREVSREFVYAIVDGLHDLMTERVTLTSLFRAKLVVIKLLVEDGWCERLLGSFPAGMLPGNSNEHIEFMQHSMRSSLSKFEQMANNVSDWLSSQNMSEEDVLAHPRLGRLSESTMVAYRQGELTIGRLLELQPMAIIKNTG